MFTYDLENIGKGPLYERLTVCIRNDILCGVLRAGEKLPSKRRAADALGISVITVQSAYDQLYAEGYIVSKERRGYYVAEIEELPQNYKKEKSPADTEGEKKPRSPSNDEDIIDLTKNSVAAGLFPLSVWSRLSRRVLNDVGEKLLLRVPVNGAYSLRAAIADILVSSRGIEASPEQIIIGAGNESLYGMLLTLLGRDKIYAVEVPCYRLIPRLYTQNGATVRFIPLDREGVRTAELDASGADILHISPAHHFPTGTVTSIARRRELLKWAEDSPDRYIIEDDYDSEFRLSGKPIPSMQRLDMSSKVIYVNTFSKTVAPSLRISYAVLPRELLPKYHEMFDYLSCPVAAFEQYTLAAFISEGYFERHINRMKTYYRGLRDTLRRELMRSECASLFEISGDDAGLHFLLSVKNSKDDIIENAERCGLKMNSVINYFMDKENLTLSRSQEKNGLSLSPSTLVINYSGLPSDKAEEFVKRLNKTCKM